MAKRIRQVGADRVLYGSDAAAGDNLRPREEWAAFRKLPLTDREFETIAGNVAPYFRTGGRADGPKKGRRDRSAITADKEY